MFILSSGAAASVDVEKDVLQPSKHLHLKTLRDMNKKAYVTMTMNRVVQYKQQVNVAFQLFMKSQNQGLQLNLKEFMVYPLTPVPYNIGTADDLLAKADMFKCFTYPQLQQPQ